MLRFSNGLRCAFLVCFCVSALSAQQPATDWATWGGDPERTSWARGESALTRQNVSGLELLWTAQLDAVPDIRNHYATLTDPLVVQNVATPQGPKSLVFVASAKDTVYAVDADSGEVVWQRSFPNTLEPAHQPTGGCPNALNATPVIDKENGRIYVLTSDGKLRALGLADGEDLMPPTDFVPPYARSWSLNLIDGVVYTANARGCGNIKSHFAAMDVSDSNRPVTRFYTSPGKPNGAWGRAGVVAGPQGIYTQTADGPYDPAGGRFGESVLALSKDLRLVDSYTPANWEYLNKKDLDLGSASPVVFPFEQWTLLAAAAKEGVIYLLDANQLGGDDHHTPLYLSPRYGNDPVIFGDAGVWGALSTWVDPEGERWLYIPMLGPPAAETAADFPVRHGESVNGNIMAFQIKLENDKPVAVPMWRSRDLDQTGMPIIANGVMFVLANGDRARDELARARREEMMRQRGGAGPQRRGGPRSQRDIEEVVLRAAGAATPADIFWYTDQRTEDGQDRGQRFESDVELTHAVLYALDAKTGEEIYSSTDAIDSWNHYGSLALSNGRLYVSTFDARVYAFGIKE